MKKLLHERLREIAPCISKSCDDGWGIDELREAMNVACYSTYQSDLKNTVLAIADEIEKYYIPRPRYEDGEPIQFGCEFADGAGNPHTLHEIRYRDKAAAGLGAKCLLEANTNSPKDYDGISFNLWDGQAVKRPAPKVLDADGVPCKKGETVWLTEEGTKNHRNVAQPMEIECFYPEGAVGFHDSEGTFHSTVPDVLTHREPDSLKKLRDEMLRWTYNPARPGEAVKQWANRLTAIMERDA